MLTIAYMTCRRNPRFEWFVDSLARQHDGYPIKLLVIDFFREERDLSEYARKVLGPLGVDASSHSPKPTVWQGKHRLTKENFFAASNARNTAICLAADGYLVFADDLSVLGPQWLRRVRAAERSGYVVCGAYEKVLELTVEDGVIIHKKEYAGGQDVRAVRMADFGRCPASWFFGCSCGAPVEAFVQINGYPEIADGMGYEDCVTGNTLCNSGFSLRYDPMMMTSESEEAHHEEAPFTRIDPGVSPNDKSHAMLNLCRNQHRFANYFGDAGIDGLRKQIQAGLPFEVMSHPDREWFTGTHLSELTHA